MPRNATGDALDSSAYFSLRQTQGAMTFTPEDIRSRTTAGKTRNRSQDTNGSKFAEFKPALSSKAQGSKKDPGSIFQFCWTNSGTLLNIVI